MIRNKEPDQVLSQIALSVWENEGGSLDQGAVRDHLRGKDIGPGKGNPLRSGAVMESISVRTWNAVVIFQRPFILDGFGDVQPGGAYSIDTEEERVSGSPADADKWRRTDTKIRLVRNGATKYVSVDPEALLAALHRDKAQSDSSSAKNTATARRSTARRLNAISWR